MTIRPRVLVTGGAGFIGSHFVRAAREAGHPVVVVYDIAEDGRDDVRDAARLAEVWRRHRIEACVHFAGKICVGESMTDPAGYYDHNVRGTLAMLSVAHAHDARAVIVSSSAAVYEPGSYSPNGNDGRLYEDDPTEPVSAYGETKLAAERALRWYERAYRLPWAALRYFNAAGAHPDGTMAERHDPETHLIPRAIDAMLGRGPAVEIYGHEHPTHDGTCVRDYVHVCDLVDAHLLALDALMAGRKVGAVNLGSGAGTSVGEVIATVTRACNKAVPVNLGPAREGDPSSLVAGIGLAERVLGWRPRRDLATIVEDAIRSRR